MKILVEEKKYQALDSLKLEEMEMIKRIQNKYTAFGKEIILSAEQTIQRYKTVMTSNEKAVDIIHRKVEEESALRMIPITSCYEAAKMLLDDVKRGMPTVEADIVSSTCELKTFEPLNEEDINLGSTDNDIKTG